MVISIQIQTNSTSFPSDVEGGPHPEYENNGNNKKYVILTFPLQIWLGYVWIG